MAQMSGSFHSYVATRIETDHRYAEWWGWNREEGGSTHRIIQERELGYRFFPHFHPYAGELIHRLVEGRIPGLQAADTDYVDNGDGTWQVLPDTTLAALSASTEVTRDGGEPLTLAAGVQVVLPDGTRVSADGGAGRLPGGLLVTPEGGVRIRLADSSTADLPAGTEVTLPDGAEVILSDGEPASVPGGTALALFGGRPRPVLHREIFTGTSYEPTELVERPYPVRNLDFTPSGAYSVYNWELFFHVPLTIAIHLSRNQQFEASLRWFHLVFDPTDDGEGPTPERFWKVKPFQYTDAKLIEEILVNLSTGADPALRQETIRSLGAWKDDPFRPHVVARHRHTAYMFKTVMAYLDNLVDWGDSLFRQDTGESIDEATQLYVLAASILGPRPQAVPSKSSVRPQTYANLRADLDEFGNAMREAEPEIPFDLAPHPTDAGDLERFGTLRSIGNTLYFCVPRNDRLLDYWDTVADRLFKIRNSLNIQGIFRRLPLFEPPIDPALLAKAAAAGLDVGAVVSGVNQPLPLVRFRLLVQKAGEICQEVRSLGQHLLSALEKEDNERLAILRARHERLVLELAESVRYAQWQETVKAREGVEKTLEGALQRHAHYERLLGREAGDITLPELEPLDTEGLLEKLKFRAGEPEVPPREVPVEIAGDPTGEAAGRKLSSQEVRELARLADARSKRDTAGTFDQIGSFLAVIPSFSARFQPLGAGGSLSFGGSNLAAAMSATASFYKVDADKLTYDASQTAKIGSYSRREQEWAFQSNAAAAEMTQIFRQLRAAQIREAVAEREWKNHQKQIENAEAVERFLTDEKEGSRTNQGFYAWMKREARGLHGKCFQFAFDVARKAERALQHELGDPDLSFLELGYLSGREGLLAGEKLALDLKRMEMAYHDQNRREYELTKHVSLAQVDPRALLELRTTGRCTVSLPETLFDMDGPGHYFRRIKSVALSVPAVVGPYTGLNCTLTLLKSSVRTSPLLRDGEYARRDAEDDRFSDNFSSLESVVTSTGRNDPGMFEASHQDERYLPFENSGVISEWRLELPANPGEGEPRQFDYGSISDVVLHLRYTARQGGALLRDAAVARLSDAIDAAEAAGSVRLFSLRHDFPSSWARFRAAELDGETPVVKLTVQLREEHYPFWSEGRLEEVREVRLFAETETNTVTVGDRPDGGGDTDTLVKDASLGGLRAGGLTNIALPEPTGEFTIYLDDNSMEEMWLAVTWGKGG